MTPTRRTQKPAAPPAPAKPEPALDMDALLAQPPAEEEAQEAPQEPAEDAPAAEEETPTQRRIRELQEALAEPDPEPETEALSEEERLIRDLEDQLARKRGAQSTTVAYDTAEDGEKILLHFLEDGFSIAGSIWYRGQEVEFVVGSDAYKQQQDRNGKSWLDLVNDTAGQYKRWGRQMFAAGPWPGRAWDDFSHLTDPEEIRQAEQAAEAERRRGRKAPLI